VLWGNVASALAGAAGMLADMYPDGQAAHPGASGAAGLADRAGVAERAGVIVAQALAQPPLAGTGRLVRPDPEHARRFLVRHNCCLYYRIPGGATCGDCVLTPEPARRRHWRSVLAAPR
jgi:FhuF 2Fe-2S C-terminal domain